jgi:pyruvate/2-oxoglutarate/acetoin dehydrogenase E1 component
MKNKISFVHAINQALFQFLKKDKKLIVVGLGVDDPKGIFETTLNLKKKFPNNVFDMPTAENSMAGICLGLVTKGFKSVIVHQRVEFSLLAMEQIINQIAKWNYMSAGKSNAPLVIRLIIGKGWGQGPQHSQSLEVLFAHIPGLKVVAPSNPNEAKGMMIASIKDSNPVIFYEHRWLHNIVSDVPVNYYLNNLNKAKVIKKGKDITIISFSNALLECLKAEKYLKENFNISPQIIDIRILRPLDKKTILKNIDKTKNILLVDNGMKTFGITAEISALINEEKKKKFNIRRIGVTEVPIPSTVSLAKYCYPEYNIIVKNVLEMLNISFNKKKAPKETAEPDKPDNSFTGPF